MDHPGPDLPYAQCGCIGQAGHLGRDGVQTRAQRSSTARLNCLLWPGGDVAAARSSSSFLRAGLDGNGPGIPKTRCKKRATLVSMTATSCPYAKLRTARAAYKSQGDPVDGRSAVTQNAGL